MLGKHAQRYHAGPDQEKSYEVSPRGDLRSFLTRILCCEYFTCLHFFSPGGLRNRSAAFWLASSVRLESLPPSAGVLSFPSAQNARPFSSKARRDSSGSCRSPHAPLVRVAQAGRDTHLPCALHIQLGFPEAPAGRKTASAGVHCAEFRVVAAPPAIS